MRYLYNRQMLGKGNVYVILRASLKLTKKIVSV